MSGSKNEYLVIGLMSGTSLDGLDIAACRLSVSDGNWSYEILNAETKSYSDEWKSKLASAHLSTAVDISLLHIELGKLHGKWVSEFIDKSAAHFDFIASHGHTVFHQPEKSMTLQIGSAAHIAAACNLPVIADFRSGDVALGGQGAPLVPIGDLLLFPEYDYCLNLGGVANISDKTADAISAFDICICNMALNHLASSVGKDYDAGGSLAASGRLNEELLRELNSLSFFSNKKPKSLSKEFFESEILPLISRKENKIEDILRTFVEHIAMQIARVTEEGKSMLITGGGAYNSFLIERIKALSKAQLSIPDDRTIQFKEALIFALLGVLRQRGEVNCLASVTGASRDSSGGAIYLP